MNRTSAGSPKGRQSLDKRLEVEAEGGDDVHYHFHGPAKPLSGFRGSSNSGRHSDDDDYDLETDGRNGRMQPLGQLDGQTLEYVRVPRFEIERITRTYKQTRSTESQGKDSFGKNHYAEFLAYPMSEYLAMRDKYGVDGSAKSKANARLFYDPHGDEFYIHKPSSESAGAYPAGITGAQLLALLAAAIVCAMLILGR